MPLAGLLGAVASPTFYACTAPSTGDTSVQVNPILGPPTHLPKGETG